MVASATDLAWLAGIVDGEGTIGISRTNSKSAPRPYLRPHFQVVNTNKAILGKVQRIVLEVTGKWHNLVVTNKATETWKQGYRIAVHTQWELLLLLPALLPYMASKCEQAEQVIEFCKRRGDRLAKRWHEFAEQDEAAYSMCLGLNWRGAGQAPATLH